MKRFLFACTGIEILGITACSDPEKKANVIFVDAANEIQSAQNLPAWDRLQAYISASQKNREPQGR